MTTSADSDASMPVPTIPAGMPEDIQLPQAAAPLVPVVVAPEPTTEGPELTTPNVPEVAASTPAPGAPLGQPAPHADFLPAAGPAPSKRTVPRQRISDDTLAAWQATLADDRAAKARAAHAALAAKAHAARRAQEARERAVAFRHLRDALRTLDIAACATGPDATLTALQQDKLAMGVHQAPEHIRTVLELTLREPDHAPCVSQAFP